MKRYLILVMLLALTVLAAKDLYYVIDGGTIHQFSPAPYGDKDWLYFSNGIRFNIKEGEPQLPQVLMVSESDYYIVHCRGPIYPDYVQFLKETGAQVYSYLPNYAFIMRMDGTTKDVVAHLGFVDWIGIYQPAYKISGQEEFKNLTGYGKIRILLYPDAALEPVLEYLRKKGGNITDIAETKWDKLINVEIDLSLVPEIARIEEVNWIEPWHMMQTYNDNVQWILQTATSGNRRVWNMGIRGNGQLLSTCDTGIRTSHYAFRSTASSWITTWGDYPSDRKIIAYKPANNYGAGYADFGDEAINYYHGTHTAGTITGDDTLNGTSTRDGMAIKGRIYFLDGGGSQGAVYLYPNLNDLYILPYNGNAAGSVKIMSNSWGSATGGAYDASCAQSDQFMWDHKDFLLFFSNGNNGPGANTVGSPAAAKNVVSVGGCQNGANYQYIYTYSSRGPTDDGRFKPTIIAPAQTVYSAYGAGDNQYIGYEGTSMASPGAAGAGVLVRQYFKEGWYPTGSPNPQDSINPSAALIKAMLICSADPSISGYTVPDNNIGWGRIDLDSVLYFAGDTKKLAIVDDHSGLSTGQYIEYVYNVVSNTVPFRVALVWTDYPATAGAGKKLINDLHLLVTDPNGNQYKGNVYSGGQSTTGGSYDTLNVEECVRRNSPPTGNWTVRVSGFNCPYGPQPYAIVVTGDLGTISQPNVVYQSNTIDDATGNNNGRVDPGETVNIIVVLRNDGTVNATNGQGTLRTTSPYITLLDSVADYGTIAANGGTASGLFQFSASASTPAGTVIPMTVYFVSNGGSYTTNCNFQIVVGLPRYDYVNHNKGNCVLTVTKQGAIGFLEVQGAGSGFIYPKTGSNQLFHASLGLANAPNYVVDRHFPNAGSSPNNTDWRCTTVPDGRCWIDTLTPSISDQESWAMYADSGHSAPKGIIVTQHGYAWSEPGYDDFVIMLFDIKNAGSSVVSNLYTGIIADFDMGAVYNNRAAGDTIRRLGYMWIPSSPNLYVGVKLLYPYTWANVSALDNTNYCYQGSTNIWHDTTFYKFLNGTLHFYSVAIDTDYSVVVSTGPYSLNPQETKIIAFAFVGGTSLSSINENADSAQSIFDEIWFGIEEEGLVSSLNSDIFRAPHPNPFTNKTCFGINLIKSSRVTIRVYDITGSLVRTILDAECKGGFHNVYWDGSDDKGIILPSGVYFYSLKINGSSRSGKLILLR